MRGLSEGAGLSHAMEMKQKQSRDGGWSLAAMNTAAVRRWRPRTLRGLDEGKRCSLTDDGRGKEEEKPIFSDFFLYSSPSV